MSLKSCGSLLVECFEKLAVGIITAKQMGPKGDAQGLIQMPVDHHTALGK